MSAFKIDSHVKAPRQKKPKSQQVPESAHKAMKLYADVCKLVYGVRPLMRYDVTNKMCYVGSNKEGCSVQRLRELTTMLKARVE